MKRLLTSLVVCWLVFQPLLAQDTDFEDDWDDDAEDSTQPATEDSGEAIAPKSIAQPADAEDSTQPATVVTTGYKVKCKCSGCHIRSGRSEKTRSLCAVSPYQELSGNGRTDGTWWLPVDLPPSCRSGGQMVGYMYVKALKEIAPDPQEYNPEYRCTSLAEVQRRAAQQRAEPVFQSGGTEFSTYDESSPPSPVVEPASPQPAVQPETYSGDEGYKDYDEEDEDSGDEDEF